MFLGSVLLEKNRWRHSEPPALKLSTFAPSLVSVGFDQVELWEFHYLKADAAERDALLSGPLSFPIFNTYAEFKEGSEFAERLALVREAVLALGSRAIKFNVPKQPELLDAALGVAKDWIATFPAGIRLYCECHPGTSLEVPEAAAKAFEELPDDRFAAIIHALASPADQVELWLNALGKRIAHVHIQSRNDAGKFCPSSERPDRAEQTFELLRTVGFKGTATLEFTTGCATKEETPEALLEAAMADKAFIEGLWTP